MPPKGDETASDTDPYTDSDSSSYTDSDTDSSSASTPAPRAAIRGGAEASTSRTTGSRGRHAALNDEQLQSKPRSAQERLEGLDKHVLSLKEKAEQQDAIARGKLPPEQTAAYAARVKELEATKAPAEDADGAEREPAGGRHQERHPQPAPRYPRADKEAKRREMIERVQREAEAAARSAPRRVPATRG